MATRIEMIKTLSRFVGPGQTVPPTTPDLKMLNELLEDYLELIKLAGIAEVGINTQMTLGKVIDFLAANPEEKNKLLSNINNLFKQQDSTQTLSSHETMAEFEPQILNDFAKQIYPFDRNDILYCFYRGNIEKTRFLKIISCCVFPVEEKADFMKIYAEFQLLGIAEKPRGRTLTTCYDIKKCGGDFGKNIFTTYEEAFHKQQEFKCSQKTL